MSVASSSLIESLSAIDVLDALLRDNARPPSTDPTLADGEGPVVELVRHLVRHAFLARASDLHLEPQAHSSRVRLRIDGAMAEAAHLPGALHSAIVNRVKVLADLDIVEHRRPQDGQFSTEVDGVGVDVRVSSLPGIFGEKLVLRLLDTRRAVISLAELGMSPTTATICRGLVRSPFGLVLCAGPTGSGKTTTLYANLLEVDTTAHNVTTIEDPVEYVMPGVTQVPTDERVGLTFATGLRALLRQDPDVILVGEVRDVDTARIAVQSALTGHLVMSSIHGTDAVGALYRLLDMGVEPFLVASAVTGVVGQRLVRRVCRSCARRVQPDPHETAFWFEHHGPTCSFVSGRGCHDCGGTGFRGRIGVYEMLVVDTTMRSLLLERVPLDAARRTAVERGMRPLVDEAMTLVATGVTTIAEVARLLSPA